MLASQIKSAEDAVTAVRSLADYIEYNYGKRSPIAAACRAGDVDGFLRTTARFTEMMDAKIVQYSDRISVATGRWS